MGKYVHVHNFFLLILLAHIANFIYVHSEKKEDVNKNPPKTRKNSWHRRGEIPTTETSQVVLKMATPCTSPNNDDGYCVNLEECPLLLKKWQDSFANNFLRESYCHPPNANNIKVCCGKYNEYRRMGIELPHQDLVANPLPKICGHHNVTTQGRIFGGTEASLGEFPWMVRLYHRNRFGYKTPGCSGFLIHSKYVITAAHCIKNDNIEILGNVVEVQLGEHNTRTFIDCTPNNTTCADPSRMIRVQELIVHEGYDKESRSHYNDIALIHLKKAARFSPYIYPLCLMEEYGNYEPFEYWISGWGKTETRDDSNVKMKVSIPPFPFKKCQSKYSDIDIVINRNQICAGGKVNEDSCTGDSGGPLMVVRDGNHWYATGVVSFGLGCGKENWPGIYTNVTSYIKWIKTTIVDRSTRTSSRSKTAKASKIN